MSILSCPSWCDRTGCARRGVHLSRTVLIPASSAPLSWVDLRLVQPSLPSATPGVSFGITEEGHRRRGYVVSLEQAAAIAAALDVLRREAGDPL